MAKRQGKSGTIDVKALLAGDEEFLRALVRPQEVLEVETTAALGVETTAALGAETPALPPVMSSIRRPCSLLRREQQISSESRCGR